MSIEVRVFRTNELYINSGCTFLGEDSTFAYYIDGPDYQQDENWSSWIQVYKEDEEQVDEEEDYHQVVLPDHVYARYCFLKLRGEV